MFHKTPATTRRSRRCTGVWGKTRTRRASFVEQGFWFVGAFSPKSGSANRALSLVGRDGFESKGVELHGWRSKVGEATGYRRVSNFF